MDKKRQVIRLVFFWWERVVLYGFNFFTARFALLVCLIYGSAIPRAKNAPPEHFLNALSNPPEVRAAKEKNKSTEYSMLLFGGRGWIRTTEVTDNRFTVCPLWPLGNSPIFN